MKKLIIFFLFGIINVFLLGGCGKADNRVVLHSVSIGDLFSIKKGTDFIEGKISKSKLAAALVSHVSDVSEVYDISDELNKGNRFSFDEWYIFFSIKDTSGRVFTGFRCFARVHELIIGRSVTLTLDLENCATSGAEFSDDHIRIPIDEILGTSPIFN